ncbi:MAG: hypothetical protein B9S33_17315 [Pedosphaera sp. Tous-C6FEB]|nr:MAG: hypothetical protein B9S33_17315 [Pedosphaera sp. Tous-C6FEB]
MSTQASLTGNGDNLKTLVVVFLRGGADGLNMVAPAHDPGYHNARPRIAIKDTDTGAAKLDGNFVLNPILKDLAAPYHDGALAVVHAVGSEDATRSHFEAQDLMERAGDVAGGWLGRYLRFRGATTTSALSAIAVSRALPESLRGAPSATVMRSLEDFTLGKGGGPLQASLEKLYAKEHDALGTSARDTLEALRRIEQLRNATYAPAHGANYERDDFSQGLKQIARLIKARVGLEAVSLDIGGWDSHITQSAIMDPQMRKLNAGLSAFYRDLGKTMQHVTVVVLTEFGRRLGENSAFGTDHGRGSVMFVMGGGVKGGRVLTKWPGLTQEVLEGPGDLPVTINYRDVLAPVLQRHHPKVDLAKVFPDYELKPQAVYG